MRSCIVARLDVRSDEAFTGSTANGVGRASLPQPRPSGPSRFAQSPGTAGTGRRSHPAPGSNRRLSGLSVWSREKCASEAAARPRPGYLGWISRAARLQSKHFHTGVEHPFDSSAELASLTTSHRGFFNEEDTLTLLDPVFQKLLAT